MQIFFQVLPNASLNIPPNIIRCVSLSILYNFLSVIAFVILFDVSFVIIFIVFPVISSNIFPDATSSFNFRYSFLIGNNLVCDSVNHIFVVYDYYIIIYYFLNIIIPYLYNILYYIII